MARSFVGLILLAVFFENLLSTAMCLFEEHDPMSSGLLLQQWSGQAGRGAKGRGRSAESMMVERAGHHAPQPGTEAAGASARVQALWAEMNGRSGKENPKVRLKVNSHRVRGNILKLEIFNQTDTRHVGMAVAVQAGELLDVKAIDDPDGVLEKLTVFDSQHKKDDLLDYLTMHPPKYEAPSEPLATERTQHKFVDVSIAQLTIEMLARVVLKNARSHLTYNPEEGDLTDAAKRQLESKVLRAWRAGIPRDEVAKLVASGFDGKAAKSQTDIDIPKLALGWIGVRERADNQVAKAKEARKASLAGGVPDEHQAGTLPAAAEEAVA